MSIWQIIYSRYMIKNLVNFKKRILFSIKAIFFLAFFFAVSGTSYAGTLSCSITTAAGCSGTVIYRMSNSANSHAELPSQSNANYNNNVVCCTGVAGLGNSCSGTYAVAAKLSSVTNAHIEQNSQTNYANNACISVATGTVSVGYQANNCSGYDTILSSMSGTTNAHTGDGNTYTTKICATAAAGAGSVSTDIVDSGGSPVGSPSVSFAGAGFSFMTQQAAGTLGISSQKIRVTSTLSTWSLTIGATAGPSALWVSGGNNYDYNGAASAGRLQINPSVGTITAQGGCGAPDPSKGTSAYFDSGNSITLLTSSSSTGCYWDFTGVALTQDIPASQPAGNYSIGMTLTAT